MIRTSDRFGPDRIELAKRIRGERHRLGLSAAEAGERIGVSRTTYQQLEDEADPKLSTLIALAYAGFRIKAIAPELTGLIGVEGWKFEIFDGVDESKERNRRDMLLPKPKGKSTPDGDHSQPCDKVFATG